MEQIVFQGSSGTHPVVVTEDYPLRSLRFGTCARQSCIDLEYPHRLQLAYGRWMMSALLFVNRPEQVLLLGLGGGGLVHFLHHYYPAMRIRAVEKSATVIRVGRAFFGLGTGAGLEIVQADGADFVREPGTDSYDLVLVDLFTPTAMASPLFDADFYRYLSALLRSGGMAVFNLWGSDRTGLARARQAMCRGWPDGGHLLVRVPKRGNVIALARSGSFRPGDLFAARERARRLARAHGLNYGRYWRRLLGGNLPTLCKWSHGQPG